MWYNNLKIIAGYIFCLNVKSLASHAAWSKAQLTKTQPSRPPQTIPTLHYKRERRFCILMQMTYEAPTCSWLCVKQIASWF